MSSTPNHSLVPSVAKATEDVIIAGMNPAATVDTVFKTSVLEAERAVFTTLAVNYRWGGERQKLGENDA